MTTRRILLVASISGALAVGLGAFGAHGLKELLSESQRDTYQTGITYHFYHTLALLGLGILLHVFPSKHFKRAAICFILGIVFFSGSLYVLSTREVLGLTNYRWLGPITPIGGVFFIIGWIWIAIAAFAKSDYKAAN